MRFLAKLQEFLGTDKLAHFGIWATAAYTAYHFFHDSWWTYGVWILLVALTFIKEYVDEKNGKVWSWYDVIAGILGTIGAIIFCVI